MFCTVLAFAACDTHTHTPGEWIVDVEADCTRGGVKHNECNDCGQTVKTEGIPAIGHGYADGVCTACGAADPDYIAPDVCEHELVHHETKAPTCTEIGWDAYDECSKCDYTTYAEKAALGHDEMTNEAKEPTCAEIGWDAYITCSRCDHTTYAEKAALGHAESVYVGYAATCTEGGFTDGVKCSVCGYVITERTPISALGHKYDNDEDAECNDCGNIRDVSCKHKVTVPVSGYAPTCTEDGLTDGVKCSDCGEFTTEQKIILAKGHFTSSDRWLTILLPTCTANGTEARSCSVCNNYTAYQEIVALGHDEESHSAKAPTCTEKGWDKYVTCTRCDYTTYVEKAAIGHNEISHDGKAATCLEPGWYPYVTCSRCDYTTYAEKAAIGHNEISHNGKAATCLEPGWYPYVTCSRCDYNTYKIEDALGHSYVKNTCTRCDAVKPSEGLRFFKNADGTTCYVSGIGTCADTDIVIPSVSPEGYTVTGIGLLAFYNCSSIESVTIPDSVTRIGQEAFSYCSGLKSIIIPDSVNSIGPYAFEYCNSLNSMTLPFVGATKDGVKNTNLAYIFGTVPPSLKTVVITGGLIVDSNAFSGCSSLESVTIPGSATSIGESAFSDCSNLRSITIPEGVISIGASAFSGCSSLESVTIHDSVTRIGYYAFSGCDNLNALYITDITSWCNISFGEVYSNPLYYANNLYLNGELVTDLVIPDGVISIGYYAFSGCSSLTNVTISDTVTSVGNYAFYKCSGLKTVTISDSVINIGGYAFSGCSSLTGIIIPDNVKNMGKYVFSECSSPMIYCEATSQPYGWDTDWNTGSGRSAVWGYKGNA